MESSTYDIIATISNETILNPSFSLICVCKETGTHSLGSLEATILLEQKTPLFFQKRIEAIQIHYTKTIYEGCSEGTHHFVSKDINHMVLLFRKNSHF